MSDVTSDMAADRPEDQVSGFYGQDSTIKDPTKYDITVVNFVNNWNASLDYSTIAPLREVHIELPEPEMPKSEAVSKPNWGLILGISALALAVVIILIIVFTHVFKKKRSFTSISEAGGPIGNPLDCSPLADEDSNIIEEGADER